MLSYTDLGKQIYDVSNRREARRYLVFVVRCYLHSSRMQALHDFFTSDPILDKLVKEYPFAYEQATRSFFYKGSTFAERRDLIEAHLSFMKDKFQESVCLGIYQEGKKNYTLWESHDEGEPLRISFEFHPGQRKEGLLSLVLRLGDQYLYQMMLWIAPNKDGEMSMWIGAMQGPNMENAKAVVVKVTRRCHSYRTKNLILHATQEAAKALGLAHLYGVTNYGYYANTKKRIDKKLKTSFTNFWEESGGKALPDRRFYELPMTEYRKTMEEIPTRKRNNYRKRYVLLDEIDTSIAKEIKALLK